MTFTNPDGTAVHLKRTLRAEVARVYRAFTDPHDMAAWMWGPLASNPEAETDLREGGRYSVYIDARLGDNSWPGDRWGMAGIYALIEPGRRLIYTVHWDAPVGYNEGSGGAPVLDEVVIVEFTAVEEGRNSRYVTSAYPMTASRQASTARASRRPSITSPGSSKDQDEPKGTCRRGGAGSIPRLRR